MRDFVEPPSSFLASIATDEERIPTLYFRAPPITRRLFWLRLRLLHELALIHSDLSGTCLDFGAGGGVFLPTLANTFHKVISIDLVAHEARLVVKEFELDNVEIVEADALRTELPQAPFGTIVAADVLEHFPDLAPPTRVLQRWLADDGVLLTSLPAEGALYGFLRWLNGVEKPKDHYHRASGVERYLATHGFRRIARRFVPLRVPIAPLFFVSAWRKHPGHEILA